QEEGLMEQFKAYWQHRKEVRADQDRVRKQFKSLIKELERETAVCEGQVRDLKNRIAHHLAVLDTELSQARSRERQAFLKHLRLQFKPLMAEVEQILKDSNKFEKDAHTREKLFKDAMIHSEYDQKAIEECSQLLPILRQEIISTRLHLVNCQIDQLVDDAIITGEVFKKSEEYEPLVRRLIGCIDTTLKSYPTHLTTREPKRLQTLRTRLEKHLSGFEKLKTMSASPATTSPSPELEEELQLRLYELTTKVDEIQDEMVRSELNIAELSKLERKDRREAIEEIRNQAVAGIHIAMNARQNLSELSPKAISLGDEVPSTGNLIIDAQREEEQLAMLADYTEIQKHLYLAIEYGGTLRDIMNNALAKLPPQATTREASLLRSCVKDLVTQATVDRAKAERFRAEANLPVKPTLRLNKVKVRKMVDVWQRDDGSDLLQAKQSYFFDRLLDRGVKYKNVWLEQKRAISDMDEGLFKDFKQNVLGKEGYDIPGFDLSKGVFEAAPGTKERVQNLLRMYPRLFEDCVDYVTSRVDVEAIPRGLQNEYVGLMVSYLLEEHTTPKV
ncbi:MAG: hypothetical protein KDK78_11020, partial [Chlamydiia bacterium]|nr:hypothetical protein [Chlamydiia bacterium]